MSQKEAGIIAPGAVIGVFGSGQLGRMFTLAARALGYRVHVYSPEGDSPAGQVGDVEWIGAYADSEKAKAFAKGLDVATLEFENVPVSSLASVAASVPVRPSGEVLQTTQNRVREKRFLARHGFPVPAFRSVTSKEELDAAVADVGCPGILKTANFGYDGKGQVRIEEASGARAAWEALQVEAIYEAYVPFEKELSVLAARSPSGEVVVYPVFENDHKRHILDSTVAPARVEPRVAREAGAIVRGVIEELRVIGLVVAELFLTSEGGLLVNELAPRPHNSGHLTIDTCVTSQFEQHVRAICGLPFGSTALWRGAAMANLLGELWEKEEPYWDRALQDPDIKLHVYGKRSPRRGRKMGHLTASAESADAALSKVLAARERLLR